MKMFFRQGNLLGAIANCGIRQSPYILPFELEKTITAIASALDSSELFEIYGNFKPDKYYKFENEKLFVAAVDKVLKTVPEFNNWNVSKFLRDKGVKFEDERPSVFTDRHSVPKEEHDFIDLDACIRNVCNVIISEHIENERFEERFQASQSKG